MSQTISEMTQPASLPAMGRDAADDFAYRPVPPLAPISLFLGVCGVAGLLGIPGLAIGAVGTILGLIAIYQIRRSQGELGGRVVARLGFGLSLGFLLFGTGMHTYAYVTELPEGYTRVSFSWLSEQPLAFQKNETLLSREVVELEGKPILIKGFMYPTRQKTEISEFVLVKDAGKCCFGGQPKLSDMIVVKFREGMTVDFREQALVTVAGVFHANSISHSGELTAIYSMEGTHFK